MGKEVGGKFGRVVGARPKFGQGTGEGRNEPIPTTKDGAARLGFVLLKAEVGGGGGVVIDQADFGLSEGVEHGAVEFHEGPIFPEGGGAGGIETEPSGDFRQKVVAIFVGKVAGPDFGFHVPTAEGSGGKGETADFQFHIGDNGKGKPAEAKGVEAGGVGMADGNFHRGFFGGRKESRFFIVQGDDDGKQVEGGPFFWWFPAKAEAEIGKIGFGRVTQDLFFTDAVAGVAAELVVPNAGTTTPRIGWGEDGDGGANVAVTGGVGQVMQTGLVDFFLGAEMAGIDDIQFGPKKASDTADAVSPGESAAVVQF